MRLELINPYYIQKQKEKEQKEKEQKEGVIAHDRDDSADNGQNEE